ncbi:hypothetical protein F4680DRAFT_465889 [Xylaria scruposa]|nr:hypothetical protein F4680DRAFT_465889 [Xylaria scruposa]
MASAHKLLTFHKAALEDPFMMSLEKKNSCLTNFTAISQAAVNRLDDLVLSPYQMDSKELDDAARVRRDIEILKATNELDAAMILILSHSCNACNHGVRLKETERASPTDLADAYINDTQRRLNDMKDFASRIADRNSQVEMLEHHLKKLSTILESVKIVSPDNVGYSYKIDPINGISLVIEGPDKNNIRTQTVTSPTDLLDSYTPPSLDTPVLESTPSSPPELVPASEWASPSPSLSPSPSPILLGVPVRKCQDGGRTKITAAATNNHTPETEKKAIKNTSETGLKIPSLSIWDTIDDRDRACRQHQDMAKSRFDPEFNRVPMVFTEGLYRMRRPHADPTTQSRMVIFSGLEPSTSYTELLKKVRGGPILHATRVNSTTAMVSFVECRDAHAYVKYVNAPALRPFFKIEGVSPRVTLVDTPSYPPRDSPADLMRRGVTRCLEISSGVLLRDVRSFFAARRLWAFTETRDMEYTVILGDNIGEYRYDGEDDSDDYDEMPELVEGYVSVDHNQMHKMEPKQVPRPPPDFNGRVIRISFRDLIQAERAFGLIASNFRGCEVRYTPDPCAGPLKELDVDDW